MSEQACECTLSRYSRVDLCQGPESSCLYASGHYCKMLLKDNRSCPRLIQDKMEKEVESFREGTAGPVAKHSLTTSSSPRIPPNNCFTSASSHLV
jgi:hypothetical protein